MLWASFRERSAAMKVTTPHLATPLRRIAQTKGSTQLYMEYPEGPRTQTKDFRAQILQYQWYLGTKTSLFGSLDPSGYTYGPKGFL